MRVLVSTVVVLLLVSGLTLLGYARWTGAVRDADAALASGDLDAAIAGYQTAEARFEALPAAKQIVSAEYTRTVGNHLWALYRLKRYDEVIDLAQKAPPESRAELLVRVRVLPEGQRRGETGSAARAG